MKTYKLTGYLAAASMWTLFVVLPLACIIIFVLGCCGVFR